MSNEKQGEAVKISRRVFDTIVANAICVAPLNEQLVAEIIGREKRNWRASKYFGSMNDFEKCSVEDVRYLVARDILLQHALGEAWEAAGDDTFQIVA